MRVNVNDDVTTVHILTNDEFVEYHVTLSTVYKTDRVGL